MRSQVQKRSRPKTVLSRAEKIVRNTFYWKRKLSHGREVMGPSPVYTTETAHPQRKSSKMITLLLIWRLRVIKLIVGPHKTDKDNGVPKPSPPKTSSIGFCNQEKKFTSSVHTLALAKIRPSQSDILIILKRAELLQRRNLWRISQATIACSGSCSTLNFTFVFRLEIDKMQSSCPVHFKTNVSRTTAQLKKR